jgi:hypothetical protein
MLQSMRRQVGTTERHSAEEAALGTHTEVVGGGLSASHGGTGPGVPRSADLDVAARAA